MKRRRNALIAISAIVAIVVIGAFAARRGARAIPVREAVVRYATLRTTLPESGVIELPQVVTIPAGASGNLGVIAAYAGERVAAGQLLATIVNEQLISNLHDAQDTLLAAQGKEQSVAQSTGAVPQENRSAVMQAQANVVAARETLTQARKDLIAGAQSGLGYGGETAEEQRVAADATLAKAQTDLAQAKRTYEENAYLYSQKGISQDALLKSRADYAEAQVTYDQARSERRILEGTLSRETSVLKDRVNSAEDGLREALAALASARANALETKAGDLESARAEVQRDAADLAYAQTQVDRLKVVAPFPGVIESVAAQPDNPLRPIEPGAAVTQGQALFTLSADNRYIVRTLVDEQDIAGVRVGQRAIVSGEDLGNATLQGTVVAIAPTAQKSQDPSDTSRQVLTTIALLRSLPFLRDGMNVDVDIVTRDRRHVLTVPMDAVRKDARGAYVFAVVDGKATRVQVTLGAQNNTEVAIRAGLHPGETVVADKDASVAPQDPVTPLPSASPAAAASL